MVETQSESFPAKSESQRKQVEEIAANCEELPEIYIRKEDEEHGHIGAFPLPTAEIPLIDMGLLKSSPSELDKLKSALTLWGCFQAINHGIERSLIEKTREISRQFFKRPMEEKKKYLRTGYDAEGYGYDPLESDGEAVNWKDRLCITLLPKHKQKLQFWPQNPSNFRQVLDEYGLKVQLINEVILKALARSLKLEENCFLNQCGENATLQGRFNYYPICRWPDKVLGIRPHADGSAITVLLQDEKVPGLQLLKDDQWFEVPIVQDALTINIGDQMQIMSNGIFKSPLHRVVTNSKNERMTLAMFFIHQMEKDIGPLEHLITDERPRLYKNVTFSHDFSAKHYKQGKWRIDAVTI